MYIYETEHLSTSNSTNNSVLLLYCFWFYTLVLALIEVTYFSPNTRVFKNHLTVVLDTSCSFCCFFLFVCFVDFFLNNNCYLYLKNLILRHSQLSQSTSVSPMKISAIYPRLSYAIMYSSFHSDVRKTAYFFLSFQKYLKTVSIYLPSFYSTSDKLDSPYQMCFSDLWLSKTYLQASIHYVLQMTWLRSGYNFPAYLHLP